LRGHHVVGDHPAGCCVADAHGVRPLFSVSDRSPELWLPFRPTLFQFCGNHKFLLAGVVFDAKQIRFATDLAIFYIGLAAASRLVHSRPVGLAASRALESGLHADVPSIFVHVTVF
jgi:hypothetical protein